MASLVFRLCLFARRREQWKRSYLRRCEPLHEDFSMWNRTTVGTTTCTRPLGWSRDQGQSPGEPRRHRRRTNTRGESWPASAGLCRSAPTRYVHVCIFKAVLPSPIVPGLNLAWEVGGFFSPALRVGVSSPGGGRVRSPRGRVHQVPGTTSEERHLPVPMTDLSW